MSASIDLSPEHDILVRRLMSINGLDAADRRALAALPLALRDLPADAEIVGDGDRPSACTLLLEGFACRYKVLEDGQRQILAFHLPGDVPDLPCLHLHRTDHAVTTLSPARVATIPHAALLELIARRPQVGVALWKVTLIDGAIYREWLTGVGRRTAKGRMAHLLSETLCRMEALALSDDGHGFEWPVTQAELADALGLTAVHVNRILGELRREGLVAFGGRTWTVLDRPGMDRAGAFDAAYLHISHADPS